MQPIALAAAGALALTFQSAPSPQEWTRFRGPNGSGVSTGLGPPTEFGPERNRAWRSEIPYASSSPVLTQDAVYVTASSETKLALICLERTSGARRWMRELDRSQASEFYAGNDSASPTPVTDGRNVYAFFPELGLVACDAQGELLWSLPLGPFDSFYGMAASPILAGDALILLCDQQKGSYLLAVDKRSGKVLWKTEREGMIESWTTPVLHPAEAPRTVVVFGTFQACGYALDTGSESWRVKGLGFTPVCSPVTEGDRIYVSAPFQAEQPWPSFEALCSDHDRNEDQKLDRGELAKTDIADHFGWGDADDDGFIVAEEWAAVLAGLSNRDFGLVAIDLVQSEEGVAPVERWRHKRTLPAIATPLCYQGVLYLARDGGLVTTLDAATGAVLETGRLPDAASSFFASPVAADGRVFVASLAGDVYVLKAGGDWDVLAVNALGEEIHATPAIGEGEIYVRTRAALSCFRTPSER